MNYTCHINVTVLNNGEFPETFNVTVYANFTEVGKREVTLNLGENTTITFIWNTTGFDKGNYTIMAVADTVPGETDLADNTLVDGWIIVTIPGDIDGDSKVTMGDIIALINAFGSRPGMPNWNPNCDINDDHKVSMDDVMIAVINFGKHDP
jgi:hypothetical protein